MVQAYILIQSEVGKSSTVADAVSAIPGVTAAQEVTGPYDVIAQVQADTVADLGQLVIAKIQDITGITRTLTCTLTSTV